MFSQVFVNRGGEGISGPFKGRGSCFASGPKSFVGEVGYPLVLS